MPISQEILITAPLADLLSPDLSRISDQYRSSSAKTSLRDQAGAALKCPEEHLFALPPNAPVAGRARLLQCSQPSVPNQRCPLVRNLFFQRVLK
mmetsp:Transcript_29978/g.51789  ORF Transcript_29978/g.51789 Transcript_29978/m.51789 type:complete len:94 (-) Transcript_29978:1349-1630(-)